MKKQVLKAFLVVAIVASASTAMAITSFTGSAVTIGNGTFSPSAKVLINIMSIPTSYAATSAHLNGLKQYATVGGANLTGTFTDPSKIYSKVYATTPGSAVATPDTGLTATSLTGTGWE